ncbi:hypothetical protein [Fibrobacter sp.]|uniref:hypothetical protein n=1 Tax=Fibrobacter sp. TaxID=35828 RepID=UPI0038690418
MKFLKILFCGGLVSFLGCAGSGSTAGHNDADDIRARAELAYSELDNVALSSSSNTSQDAERPLQTVVDSRFSLVELLQSSTCPDADDLRGVGIAGDASAALVLAQKDIAVQIQSVVAARIEDVRRSDVDADGNEFVQSSLETRTLVLTRLQNAQDAKPIATLNSGDKFGVVACMRRADAARPFIQEFNLLQDSLKLAVKLFEEQKHPLVKNDAFRTAQNAYVRLTDIGSVIKGIGAEFDDNSKLMFESLQQKYSVFRSQYAFYYQLSGDKDALVSQLHRSTFERISERYPVRTAKCTSGLLLKLDISPVECSEGSLGIACVSDLSLSGSSCEGESYFSLQAKVKGAGRYDTKEAKKRLRENVSKGAWFKEWVIELDKWRLK